MDYLDFFFTRHWDFCFSDSKISYVFLKKNVWCVIWHLKNYNFLKKKDSKNAHFHLIVYE